MKNAPNMMLWSTKTRAAQRGQTLIVALLVLFALLFLGGVFVTRIARNLVQSGQSQKSSESNVLAKAGLDYCNQQLDSSPQGADWRPTPTPPTNTQDPDFYWLVRGFSRIQMNGGRALVRVAYDPTPDNTYLSDLVIESVGRPGALPNPPGSDPTVFVSNGNSPRMRTELTGVKQIGITDYALYVTGLNRRTVPNFVGTPSIGVNVATVLGNPMLGFTQYAGGVNSTTGNSLYGYPMYVNGDLTLGGDTYLYESHLGGNTDFNQESIEVNGLINLAPDRQESAYTTLPDNALPAYLNEEIDVAPTLTNTNGIEGGAIVASNGTIGGGITLGFNSFLGTVRDASGQPDVNGLTRSVPRLDPPRLDAVDGAGILRYRALTRDSGFFYTDANGVQRNTGEYGYGTGIYVNNPLDLQQETSVKGVNGGYSERADWLNPQAHYATSVNGRSYGWDGPFYNAPGVRILLLGNAIQLTRDDGRQFVLPDGSTSNTLTIPLRDSVREATQLSNGIFLTPLNHNGDDPATRKLLGITSPYGDPNSYGVNLVIFAEGNVKVSGVYGAISGGSNGEMSRVHLTIVSGGTAYIDGNIVSGDGYLNGSGAPVLEHNSTCAIMAKDYVTVNTTKFMRPESANVWASENQDENPPFYTELGQSGTDTYDTSFSSGVPYANYTVGGNASPFFMMVRQSTASLGVAPLNLFYNPATVNIPYTFPFEPQAATPSTEYDETSTEMLGLPMLGSTINQSLANTLPGYSNDFRFQFDRAAQNVSQNGTTQLSDYRLGAAAMVPLDIRVEASIYAQNRSFFVIPGYSFNPDARDTRAQYQVDGNIRISYNSQDIADANQDAANTGATPSVHREAEDVFPFYNEPNDIRITLFGSIAENYTASEADQAAWMRRWGYIPAYYGSTEYYKNTAARVQVPDMHLLNQDPTSLLPGEDTTLDYRTPIEQQESGLPSNVLNAQTFPITNGIRYEYNPQLAMPYVNPTSTALINLNSLLVRQQNALRCNVYTFTIPGSTESYTIEQMLPAVPDMPVCPNLLYGGVSGVQIGSLIDDTDQYQ